MGLACGVEKEFEIGIAQAVGKRLNSDDGAVWKRGVNDSLQERRRQGAARLATDPAGFVRGARDHTNYHRPSASLGGED
jgi:hypothetical protein